MTHTNELLEALKALIGPVDDPKLGWRSTQGTETILACEFCSKQHEDCTLIVHLDDCPIPQARAAIARAEKAERVEPDMPAICAALGFDPTNHHNAAKCPYCRPPAAPEAERVACRLNPHYHGPAQCTKGVIGCTEAHGQTEQAERVEPVSHKQLFDAISAATNIPYGGAIGISVKAFEAALGGKVYTTPPAAEREPINQISEAARRHGLTLVKTANGYDFMKLGTVTAH